MKDLILNTVSNEKLNTVNSMNTKEEEDEEEEEEEEEISEIFFLCCFYRVGKVFLRVWLNVHNLYCHQSKCCFAFVWLHCFSEKEFEM